MASISQSIPIYRSIQPKFLGLCRIMFQCDSIKTLASYEMNNSISIIILNFKSKSFLRPIYDPPMHTGKKEKLILMTLIKCLELNAAYLGGVQKISIKVLLL